MWVVAGSVTVRWCGWRAEVIEEDLPVAPGLVLVGDHVVLQIAHLLSFLKVCSSEMGDRWTQWSDRQQGSFHVVEVADPRPD